MLCMAVIVLCVIIGYVTASNGEWGPFALCVVIAIGALIMSDNDLFRAQNNWVDHWAHPERRNKQVRDVRRTRRRSEDRQQSDGGSVRVMGVETAAEVENTGDTTVQCMVCGGVMREKSRLRYSSGTVYVTCRCERCGRETPVKIR